MGWDDDGDSGSSTFYPGDNSMGYYDVDLSNCSSAIDLNPAHGTSNSGVSASARSFDFNFDGKLDIMLGFQYTQGWGGPSKALLYLGDGTGSFDGGTVVRDFPNNIGNNFAIPQPLCARFPF